MAIAHTRKLRQIVALELARTLGRPLAFRKGSRSGTITAHFTMQVMLGMLQVPSKMPQAL